MVESLFSDIEVEFRRIMRQSRNKINQLLGDKLTGNELFVLKIIHEEGPKKAVDIAKHFHVSASHITNVIDTLANRGFVERKRSETDRRILQLAMTPAGEKVLKEVEKIKAKIIEEKFADFTGDDLNALLHLLKKIR